MQTKLSSINFRFAHGAAALAFIHLLAMSSAHAQNPAPPQVPQLKGANPAKPAANLIEPQGPNGKPLAPGTATGAAVAPGVPTGPGSPNGASGGAPNATGAPGKAAGAAGAAQSVDAQTDAISRSLFAGLMDPFEYDARGRKDPFVQPIPEKALAPGTLHGPILPLQAYNLEQLRLVGIIWDVRHPKAMIKDPDGKTHIVGPNTKLGPKNGYIAIIREGEMVVVETTEEMGKLVSTAQVVKIAK